MGRLMRTCKKEESRGLCTVDIAFRIDYCETTFLPRLGVTPIIRGSRKDRRMIGYPCIPWAGK
ncbi:MAG TPA: hypothetical protein DCR97_13380 [Deltaproteobacteria bacterium]|nr:hypothetical protein [Deltaproteobacteria bacterium]